MEFLHVCGEKEKKKVTVLNERGRKSLMHVCYASHAAWYPWLATSLYAGTWYIIIMSVPCSPQASFTTPCSFIFFSIGSGVLIKMLNGTL